MKKLSLTVMLVVCLLVPSKVVFANEAAKTLALQSAKSWLELVDSAMYASSWERTAEPLKGNMSKSLWVQTLHSLRDPVGNLISREAQMVTYRGSMPAFPPGEYVVIQYKTSFDKRKSVIETVTVMSEGGNWKILMYYAF